MGKSAFMAASKHFVDFWCKLRLDKLYHRPLGLSGINERVRRWERAMARRGQHSFMKRQKEIKRKQKALEKMERRQGKKNKNGDVEKEQTAEPSEEEEPE